MWKIPELRYQLFVSSDFVEESGTAISTIRQWFLTHLPVLKQTKEEEETTDLATLYSKVHFWDTRVSKGEGTYLNINFQNILQSETLETSYLFYVQKVWGHKVKFLRLENFPKSMPRGKNLNTRTKSQTLFWKSWKKIWMKLSGSPGEFRKKETIPWMQHLIFLERLWILRWSLVNTRCCCQRWFENNGRKVL